MRVKLLEIWREHVNPHTRRDGQHRGDRVRETVGILGSGFSYSQEQHTNSRGLGRLLLLATAALAVVPFILV